MDDKGYGHKHATCFLSIKSPIKKTTGKQQHSSTNNQKQEVGTEKNTWTYFYTSSQNITISAKKKNKKQEDQISTWDLMILHFKYHECIYILKMDLTYMVP